MLIIGLCGRSGSGKGFVSLELLNYGFYIIDSDAVYKSIISDKNSQCTKEISDAFGDVLSSDGVVDRKKLAKIVFSDKEKLNQLNHISHRYVKIECDRIIESLPKEKYKGVIIDAPALFESKFNEFCDINCCVIASEKVRIERIIERDNISKEDAIMRLKSQIDDDFLINNCDFVINNNDDNELDKNIKEFVQFCDTRIKK